MDKKRIIKINYIFGDKFIYPINNLLNIFEKKASKKIYTSSYKNLALSLSNKLSYLRFIVMRANKEYEELRKIVNKRDRSNDSNGSIMIDDRIKYELTLDINSYFFEVKAIYELLINYCSHVLKTILNKKINQKAIIKIIKARLTKLKIDDSWINFLEDVRNKHLHITSAFLDIELNERGGFKDIIISDYYADEGQKFNFVDMNKIHRGIYKLREHIRYCLIDKIKKATH